MLGYIRLGWKDMCMYQWEQKEDKGLSEEHRDYYTYNKVWSLKVIDSKRFHNNITGRYSNPAEKPLKNKTFTAPAYVGDFLLTDMQTDKIPVNTELMSLSKEIGDAHGLTTKKDCYTNVQGDNPKIGDIKISFECVDLDSLKPVTVLAMQSGNTFETYTCKSGAKTNEVWLIAIDKDDALKSLEQDVGNARIGMWITSFVFLLIGVILVIKKKNKGVNL